MVDFTLSDSPSDSESWEKMRRIAKYHRWVVLAIAIQLGVGILSVFYLTTGGSSETYMDLHSNPIVSWLLLALNIYAAVALIFLAKELTNVIVAGVCGILAIVPPLCSILFPMLIVFHLLAMRRLKREEVDVGLFGANQKSVRPPDPIG